MIDPVSAIVGIAILLLVVGGLLYIFYSRTNAVQKTGYGALIMLALVSIMIPVFWILESNNEATATSQQFTTAEQRGMALYAQYCVNSCYTIQGNKVVDPKYNGYSIDALNQMSDQQLMRIITGGIYNPSAPAPANPNTIATSTDFGGPLSSNDASYLFSFIRSANSAYLSKNGYPSHNGFNDLVAYLQNNAPSAYATAAAPPAPKFGSPVDMTKQSKVTITIADTPNGSCTPNPACYDPVNVKVKVGTVITWVSKSSTPHTVSAIQGTSTSSPKPAPQLFDSGISKPLSSGSSFTWTVTPTSYTFNPDHTVVYYCEIHATTMFAVLTIVNK